LNRIRAQVHHDLMQLRRVAEHLHRRGGQHRLKADLGVQRAAHELHVSATMRLRSTATRLPRWLRL